jgi:DNA-binding response OmpR family regulator
MTSGTSDAVILIVDDNEMNRDVLVRRVERLGYGAHTAEDGQQALDMLAQASYDLMLLDIMMPKLNGYQVLETMKAEGLLNSTPVIVVSAVDELDSVVRCIELGAEDYLFKPFNPILLKARVNAILERRRTQRPEQHGAGAGSAMLLIDAIRSKVDYLAGGHLGPVSADQQEMLSDIQAFLAELKFQL